VKPPAGFILPAVIDPGVTLCIRLYVPADSLYLAALWGSLDYLATWTAWERDPDHRGALAADVWRAANKRSRDEYELSGGECGIVDVRQHPNHCDRLQKSSNGETWVTWANLSACLKPPTAPLYTAPTEDGRQPEEAEADDIARVVWDILDQLGFKLNGAETPKQAAQDVASELVATTGVYAEPQIRKIAEVLGPKTPAERAECTVTPWWEWARNTCVLETNTKASYVTEHADWLSYLTDELTALAVASDIDTLNAASDLMGLLTIGASSDWWTSAYASDGAGGGFGWLTFDSTWPLDWDSYTPDYTIVYGSIAVLGDTLYHRCLRSENVMYDDGGGLAPFASAWVRIPLPVCTVSRASWWEWDHRDDALDFRATLYLYDGEETLLWSDTWVSYPTQDAWWQQQHSIPDIAIPVGGYAEIWIQASLPFGHTLEEIINYQLRADFISFWVDYGG